MALLPRAQQPTGQSLQPEPQLSVKGLHILIWCCFAISTLTFVTRIIVRATHFKKIFSDDYAVCWAWAFLLGYCIVGTMIAPLSLRYQGVSSGIGFVLSGNWGELDEVDRRRSQKWPTYVQDGRRYQKLQYAQILTFVTSLYSVKLSFLLFFRRLNKGARTLPFEIYWWTTLALVILAYIGCWISQSLYCAGEPQAKCVTPYRLRMGVVGVKYSVGADVATDILIIGIPIQMLWGVKMQLMRKLFILSVLCAGLGIVVIALIRGAALKFGGNSALDRIIFWGNIELCTAFVLCSLASYKALFVGRDRRILAGETGKAPPLVDRWSYSARRSRKVDNTEAIMTQQSVNISNSSIKNDEDPKAPIQAYRGVPGPLKHSTSDRSGYGNSVLVQSDPAAS
ncbi:MAG: hypothetical protein M1814_006447 [Vezdaea aestivalis]|nr:MAG: hypothetical protein M1814_006447 [Vezdaea aestivalis]